MWNVWNFKLPWKIKMHIYKRNATQSSAILMAKNLTEGKTINVLKSETLSWVQSRVFITEFIEETTTKEISLIEARSNDII